MIFEVITGLFASLFGFLFECIAAALVLFINKIAIAIEVVVSLFVEGFSLGRITRNTEERPSTGSVIGGGLTLLILFGAIGWFAVAPKVMNRTVTLAAKDGRSLPFAAMIIHVDAGDRHARTDNAGNIRIPRFATNAITVKDPRYVEQTWKKGEIGSTLTVGARGLVPALMPSPIDF